MRAHFSTTRPLDLAAVAAWALLTAVAVALGLTGPVRVLLGLPFVLFLPGYAFVAALFPERHRVFSVAKGEEGETEETRTGIDPLERVALSLGLSIAIVPLLGLGLNFTPWGIRLAPVTVTLTAFILLACAAGAWRRLQLGEGERLRLHVDVQPPEWRGASRLDRALTVALVISIVAAGAALAYVLTKPRVGESFTEFYILGPGGMAEGYPTNVTAGEDAQLILGIVNHEHETVTYTARVVAESGQFVDSEGNRTFVSEGNVTLNAFDVTLEDEEKWEENVTFRLDTPGEYRVRFELDKPGGTDPYRRLHLFVTVTG